jgi:hypothetical protein
MSNRKGPRVGHKTIRIRHARARKTEGSHHGPLRNHRPITALYTAIQKISTSFW